MGEKVFCKDCFYLESENRFKKGGTHKCGYSDNLKVKFNWYSPKTYFIKPPKKINKNNDCKWFEKLIRQEPNIYPNKLVEKCK